MSERPEMLVRRRLESFHLWCGAGVRCSARLQASSASDVRSRFTCRQLILGRRSIDHFRSVKIDSEGSGSICFALPSRFLSEEALICWGFYVQSVSRMSLVTVGTNRTETNWILPPETTGTTTTAVKETKVINWNQSYTPEHCMWKLCKKLCAVKFRL